ncbi:MAG: hypothetical protein P8011_09560 [Acidihalobacter sp.]|jgi:hypothetical protein|uniref:hypothetical protein n=1 Tax=Acidihalobacter sp. TaxID=1872108 RepID=UPI00307E47A8
MEFYARKCIADPGIDRLHSLLILDNLPKLCASIDSITVNSGHTGDLYCLWGAFEVSREPLRCGARFSLLDCPHALSWTITYNTQQQELIVHCTIDKAEVDPDFAESIQLFVDDCSVGMDEALR